MNSYIVGQRWVSASEPELGLGIVIDSHVNRVSILFLACNERRLYAKNNNPLTRARFLIGDKIETNDNLTHIITKVIEQEEQLHYQVTYQDELLIIDEIDLSPHLQFNKPQDKLFSGQTEVGRFFSLRYKTWKHLHHLHTSDAKGLLGARVTLIPHQLYIAHEASQRNKLRVMLADEVGLGKTIEAGLILHHRLQSGLSSRILVIVPESLLHQWLIEMSRRFNLKFSLLDELRCQITSEANPFTEEQLILCSTDFFQQSPHRQAQALEANWDIIVIDEAHHLQWHEEMPSNEYLFIDQLAKLTEGLILLTATPEQLGKQSHFAQLRLLDPDRFHDFKTFLAEQKSFEPIARLAEKIVNLEPLTDQNQASLIELVDQKICLHFLQNLDSEMARQEVLDQLIDRHGTGRILFKNSRQIVKGFPKRKFYAHPLEGEPNTHETIYLHWLLGHLKSFTGMQVLLICQHAETVRFLHKQLKDRHGIKAATFHEEMSIIERDRAAAYFADPEMDVQILLCSEIGSEGRNFQFVSHLILLDLPQNPDLLQQRIGRLDRIGQKHIIKIHVPYLIGSEQHSLCRWYSEGLGLFEINSNAASEVYQQQRTQLERVCASTNQQGLDQLINKGAILIEKIDKQMHQSRDLLLELNSYRKNEAEHVIQEIKTLSDTQGLWQYMEEIFDCFGVESEEHSQGCAILQMGQAQRVSQFPGVPEEGVTVTVSREIALAREDMEYLSWEHPLVTSAMDLVLSDQVGSAAISVVKHPELPAGQYLLECLFLAECSAPSNLQLSRFLPTTPIRILIDQNHTDLTQKIGYDDLVEITHAIESDQITTFIAGEHQNINKILDFAAYEAESHMQNIVSVANANMLKISAIEIKRLDALSQVNPNIKPEEIEYLREKAITSHGLISKAKLRLDAIRFIITS